MGNGGITQLGGNLRNTHSLLIQQVTGMLHTLFLVKIKNGSPKHHLESLFEIAFINGRLSAKLLDGDGVANISNKTSRALMIFSRSS